MLRETCWVALTGVALMGCNGGGVFERARSQTEDGVRIACSCDWMDAGYDSESACVNEQLERLEPLDPCVQRAYDQVPEIHASFDCLLDANDAYLACARGARCDDATEARCGEDREAASDACPPPPEAALARANQIAEECRASAPPGMCPYATVERSGLIASGTTVGQGADLSGSCGGSSASDLAFTWTAPSAGTWVIDTVGSELDTVLYALTSCGGAELACNDDGESGFSSEITLELSAGQTIVLVVDGFGSGGGDFVLNANPL